MKSRNGSVSVLWLALAVSIMMNFVLGCQTQREAVCVFLGMKEPLKPQDVPKVDMESMEEVARCLNVKVAESDTASDIALKIKSRVNDFKEEMPEPFPDETVSKLKKLLTLDECKVLDKYQKAIKEAQGKRVLYLPIDGE